ncbi:MAG: hypothetical protein AAGI17_05960 [Planctomycetota bacterium]
MNDLETMLDRAAEREIGSTSSVEIADSEMRSRVLGTISAKQASAARLGAAAPIAAVGLIATAGTLAWSLASMGDEPHTVIAATPRTVAEAPAEAEPSDDLARRAIEAAVSKLSRSLGDNDLGEARAAKKLTRTVAQAMIQNLALLSGGSSSVSDPASETESPAPAGPEPDPQRAG